MPQYGKKPTRPVAWIGDSRKAVAAFPDAIKKDIGYQLHRVQGGDEPTDWKAMVDIGPGVREIRAQDRDGWYRAFYVATLGELVYVLCAFRKKTNATPQMELAKARDCYRAAKNHAGKFKGRKT